MPFHSMASLGRFSGMSLISHTPAVTPYSSPVKSSDAEGSTPKPPHYRVQDILKLEDIGHIIFQQVAHMKVST